jgi:nicotinamide-nucleotide amidase
MSDGLDIDEALVAQAAELLGEARKHGITIATAESCTGGLLAATLTAVPGSSDVLERGFVTYSNASKSELLGVPVWLIERHGAVSEDVARAMAGGALTHSRATIAIAVTGVAGPGGGTAEKSVGLVHFAAGRRDTEISHAVVLFEDLGRSRIRRDAVTYALTLLGTLVRMP